MKYVSIDIETTGLNPANCQVIELAMVLEDTENLKPLEELPVHRVLFKHQLIQGQWVAFQMNGAVLAEAQSEGLEPQDAWASVVSWLEAHGFKPESGARATAAGKNVAGFDLQFLIPSVRAYFSHRTIDPGSVFFDWDRGPQSLGEHLGRDVSHTATQDALDVVELLRRAYASDYNPAQRRLI